MKFLNIVLISCVWLTVYGQQEETKYEEDAYYLMVEQMPFFGNCDLDSLSKKEHRECSDKELLNFIYTNLKYPSITRCGNYISRIYFRIYIDEEGNVSEPEFLRPTPDFFETEIKRLVQLMPCWMPGKRNGIPIESSYVIPIRFHLK